MGETDGPPGGEQAQAEPAPIQFGTMPDVESEGGIPAASHGGGMPDVESKAASPSASHAASQTGARADQALFAEALQAAEELQNVASYGTPGLGATSGFDRIDALLLEEIEAEEVEANSSSQSAAYDGLAPGGRLDEREHAQVHSDPQPTTSADETTSCRRRTATLLRKTASRLGLELILALVTTSPLLVWLVALSEGLLRDGLADEYGALQLWLRPLCVWCAARVASSPRTGLRAPR